MSSVKEQPIHPRESILNAAVHLFAEFGYNGTTMRDIAKQVGVLPGSLYAHISGKDELLSTIVESGIAKFLGIIHEIEASDAPADVRMRNAIKAHVATVAENPERTLVVFHQWRFLPEPARARAVELRRDYAQAFFQILEAGVADGTFRKPLDARFAIFSILGALNWVPEWYSPQGSKDADTIGNAVADTLIKGLMA